MRMVARVGIYATMTLTAALLLGCATRSSETGTYVNDGNRLPKPARVLVADFAVDPERVSLDQGIGPRLERTMSPDSGDGRYGTALQVQSAISETLVSEIRKMGMSAERVGADARPGPNDAVVQGQVTRITEGNRTRRMVVGFGAGKSEVDATAALYIGERAGPPRLLQTYDADSNSGRKPGFGMGAASGSAAMAGISGASGVYGETKRTGVAEEGQRLAERLSYNLGTFFAEQGWIAASSVPTSLVR